MTLKLLFNLPRLLKLLGCSLWDELRKKASTFLEGANLTSLMNEIGSRLHSVLLNHVQQYRYSPHGALRLKADVNSYVESIRAAEIPQLTEKFTSIQVLFQSLLTLFGRQKVATVPLPSSQGIVNVLVVGPESVLPLVNGSLRMAHAEALKFVRLREDFEAARVEGRTLTQLLTEGGGKGGRGGIRP